MNNTLKNNESLLHCEEAPSASASIKCSRQTTSNELFKLKDNVPKEEPIKCKKCVWWKRISIISGNGRCNNPKIDSIYVDKNFCCGIGIKEK